jgi:lipopolysaccharide transport system permease protein
MLVVYGVAPSWSALFVVPILLIQVVFTTGVCLLLSAFTVLYRDARFTLPLLIQVWMFATPILYPVTIVPASLRGIYLAANPMAVVVDSYRQAILRGQAPDLGALGVAAAISLVLLWLAYRYFKHLERDFADMV